MTIKLGDRCKDKVSGFTGICTGRTEYLHGCTRITISPEGLHEGKPVDAHWFDEPQVETVVAEAYVIPEGFKTGGPPGRTATSKPNHAKK